MTAISLDDVKKLAKLSALRVSDDEAEALRSQLEDIIGFVGKLSEVDTTGVQPTYQVTDLQNIWREDIVIDYGLSQSDLLKNAPDQQDGQIKVRRVIL